MVAPDDGLISHGAVPGYVRKGETVPFRGLLQHPAVELGVPREDGSGSPQPTLHLRINFRPGTGCRLPKIRSSDTVDGAGS